MHRENSRSLMGRFLAFAFTTFLLSVSAFGQTESVVYTFTEGPDGGRPLANLISDAAGNLYGTTIAGGIVNTNGGDGVVYELSPATGGGWTESVLYTFLGGSDGEVPICGLVFDAAGNLYGTTSAGGAHNLGTVFELSPVSGGGWTKSILFNFAGGASGANPEGNLIFDAAGNLYGVTPFSGAHNQGTVFQLVPASGGGWTENVILTGTTTVGGTLTGLVFDNSGNLYVTADGGGPSNGGAVYRLSYSGGGWRSGVIHYFLGGTEGFGPQGDLIFHAPNRLFGLSQIGGTYSLGTAFELTPGTGGLWNETTLFSFGANSRDPMYPAGPLTMGPAGQLYGVSGSGGAYGSGTAYELADVGGVWKQKVLYNFGLNVSGASPGLLLDSSGDLYGAAGTGGAFGAGGVFEITP